MTFKDIEKLSETPSKIGLDREYAVTVFFVKHEDGSIGILFERRALTLHVQPDEICFPGGSVEPGETPLEGAIRETFEEIGICENQYRILGLITEFYSYADFRITVYGAEIDEREIAKIKFEPDEVADVFVLPLEEFINVRPYVFNAEILPNADEFDFERAGVGKNYPWRNGNYRIPIYEIEGFKVWGITAGIMLDIVERLE